MTTIDRRISPAIGEYAIQRLPLLAVEIDRLRKTVADLNSALMAQATSNGREIDRLRASNAELVAALRRCLSHFERIRDQQANPSDSPMMAQARAALAKGQS